MKQESRHKFPEKLRFIVLIFVVSVLIFAYFKATSFKSFAHITHIPISSISSSDHIRGNTNAEITIVEYSDFECPECQYFQPTIKQILSTYGPHIRWVVRSYPLPQHINAEKEAEAAECVASLGGNTAYWTFSDALFAQQQVTDDGTGFPLAKLPMLARSNRVDVKKFTTCLQSGKASQLVEQSTQDAIKGGINQLPSTIIIDKSGSMQLIVGDQPFSVFKSIIDQDLKG